MPRVTVDVPESALIWSTTVAVRFSDVNVARHVGNDALARMFSDVRTEFWEQIGVPQLGRGGIGMIVTDVVMSYRAEARMGDVLQFDLGVTNVNRYGADVVARVTREADAALIMLASSGFVYFDYNVGKVCPPPPEFVAKFGAPSPG